MKLKFKTGLLASLFTPVFACACSQSISVTERSIKLVLNVIYSEDVETYIVKTMIQNNYITLPEYLSIFSEDIDVNLYSYSNGVYVY